MIFKGKKSTMTLRFSCVAFKPKQLFLVVMTAFSLLMGACSSTPPKGDDLSQILPPISSSEYNSLIDQYSHHDSQYEGFHNTFQLHMTLLNSKVLMASLHRMGQYHQWNLSKARNEREKNFQELSSVSKVFISFFAPEREYNDLDKANTIWRIYLVSNGKRYEGKMKKVKSKLVDLQHLFKYHTRFYSPYEATFQVPMTAVEAGPVTIILSSSLGKSEFKIGL